MKVKQEDGTEIEVFSPEEVEKKVNESKVEFENKINELNTNLSNLAKEKEELEKQKGEIKEDHPNFKALKEALAAKTKDIEALKSSIETNEKTRQAEIMSVKIKAASKGNEEFEKKVKFHLENTLSALKEDSEENRTKKLEAAIKLSSDEGAGGPGIFDGGTGGGGKGSGSGDGEGNGNTVEFTAREKSLGAKLGITNEDYKKYGSKLTNKGK